MWTKILKRKNFQNIYNKMENSVRNKTEYKMRKELIIIVNG